MALRSAPGVHTQRQRTQFDCSAACELKLDAGAHARIATIEP